MPVIDLNADLGEGYPGDEDLLTIVSSCNIACGGHAGDDNSMRVTAAAGLANNVAIGAHPSYPDREGFGRRSAYLNGAELFGSLVNQILALERIATALGERLTHVKPHGALYNDAVNDRALSDVVIDAIAQVVPNAAFVGLPNSEMQAAASTRRFPFVAEGFIDRAYQEDGQLVPRSEPGAVHTSLKQVLPQAMSLVASVDTLCIHGDTPGAAATAEAVRSELEQQGVEIRALRRR